MKKTKLTLGKVLYFAVLAILIAVFAFSAYQLIKYFSKSQKSQQTYQQLQDLRGDFTRPAPVPTVLPDSSEATQPTTATELVTVTDPVTGQKVQLLPELAEIYLLNTDLVGWITIPDTKVNYPVVQRPEDVDYYLYRDFHGRSDERGCVYAREVCDVAKPSDNITLYGHRMRDLTMFGDVGGYERKAFWEAHPYLYFDTLTERHTYQIVCAFVTTANVGEGFSYHLFVDAAEPSDFENYVARCKAYQLYETGVSAQYGDKLITLSTCEYGQDNGRLVVVAKRID